mmetsp:Transcript_6997/g.11281  ORF Transcript_6997/g.11281 Transcript_6997/m.11281 type:complete len:193 (-) Transcript_6997:215-793(-)
MARQQPILGMEQQWDALSEKMCKCLSCFCFEHGFGNPVDPCHWSQFKLCCCRGDAHSGAECNGDKGVCGSIKKFCCCVHGCKSSCNLTICNQDLVGAPYREATSTDDDWLPPVFWLAFIGCVGCGCTGTDPMIFDDSKCCCLESKARTTHTGEGGCCNVRSKVCCCVHAQECPPSMDIGLACCGIKVVRGGS